MKLWQKSYDINKQVEHFTIGKDRELDIYLAPYDVIGSMAHARMLSDVGLISKEDKDTLIKGLKEIQEDIASGKFEIEEGVEDVHSQVEMLLTKKYGDVGKRLHTGRSRNDQVLLDLKLYFKDAIKEIAQEVKQLFDVLQEKSNEFKDVLMPGYTHMQVAMPSSFGLWLGAFSESLVDDLVVLKSAYEVVDRNPLGSAAGYGSSFPLDREKTTELMDFGTMACNVVYAQMGRGKTEFILSNGMASISSTLAKLAMDACLYAGQNYQFIKFPDELTTGSSIMPHKKNPDPLELVRARANQITILPTQINAVISNLPTGYHRDLQQVKELIIPAIQMLKECLSMTSLMFSHLSVKDNILEDPIYDYLFSVEVVNQLVTDGVPFREAYQIVGKQIDEGTFKPDRAIKHTHQGSIGDLQNKNIKDRMDEVFSLWED